MKFTFKTVSQVLTYCVKRMNRSQNRRRVRAGRANCERTGVQFVLSSEMYSIDRQISGRGRRRFTLYRTEKEKKKICTVQGDFAYLDREITSESTPTDGSLDSCTVVSRKARTEFLVFYRSLPQCGFFSPVKSIEPPSRSCSSARFPYD